MFSVFFFGFVLSCLHGVSPCGGSGEEGENFGLRFGMWSHFDDTFSGLRSCDGGVSGGCEYFVHSEYVSWFVLFFEYFVEGSFSGVFGEIV